MPSLDVFEVQHVLAQPLHLGDHLPGMSGMHPVVAGRGGEQGAGIGHIGLQVVVGREGLDELPLFGQVGIAILGHPAGSRQQLVEPPHVEQRDLADNRAEEIGPAGQHVAHEQAAIAPPHGSQVTGRRDLAGDQVFRDRDEIFVRLVAILLEGGLMPAGAKFPSTPNVRHHVHSPRFQPGRPDAGLVRGGHGDFETAIAVEQGGVGSRQAELLAGDLEVRDTGAIGRDRFVLADHEALRLEEMRVLFEPLGGTLPDGPQREAGGSEVIGDGQEVVVRLIRVDRRDRRRTQLGPTRKFLAGPLASRASQLIDAVPDIVEFIQQQVVLSGGEPGERLAIGRGEQHVELAVPGEELFEIDRQQGTGGMFLSPHFPRRPQFQEQQVAIGNRVGVGGLVDLDQLAPPPEVEFTGPEGDRAGDPVVLVPRFMRTGARDSDIARLTLEDQGGLGDGGATTPFPHCSRVARIGEAAGAEIGPDKHAVAIAPRDAGLGFGQLEAIGDELLGLGIELADDGGIGPTPRERQQDTVVAGLEEIGSLPDPVFLLFAPQFVEVEHRLPLGFGLAVLGEGGPPPEPAGVLGIAPEVVIERPGFGDEGDASGAVEDLENPLIQLGEQRVRGQFRRAGGVAFLDPVQGFLSQHLFEPLMLIDRLVGPSDGCDSHDTQSPQNQPAVHFSLHQRKPLTRRHAPLPRRSARPLRPQRSVPQLARQDRADLCPPPDSQFRSKQLFPRGRRAVPGPFGQAEDDGRGRRRLTPNGVSRASPASFD